MSTKKIVLRNPLPNNLWCPFCGVQIRKNGENTKAHDIIENLPRRTVAITCTNLCATLTIHDKEG